MSTSQKLRLDLPLLLPDVHDPADHCVDRLRQKLVGRPGIDEAHVVGVDEGKPELCVHYDPNIMSLGRLRELVNAAGIEITERFAHLTGRAKAPTHARAAQRIGEQLRALPGVLEADASPTGAIRIEYDRSVVDDETLRQRAGVLGVALAAKPAASRPADAASHNADHKQASTESAPTSAQKAKHHHDHDGDPHDHGSGSAKHGEAWHKHDANEAGGDHDHGGPFGEKTELVFAALAGVALLAGWLTGRAGAGPDWLPTACYVVTYFFGGFYTV